jgi:hypothetical protein
MTDRLNKIQKRAARADRPIGFVATVKLIP